jgi:hypothetical protein
MGSLVDQIVVGNICAYPLIPQGFQPRDDMCISGSIARGYDKNHAAALHGPFFIVR